MKRRLLYSLLLGAILPFSYFLFADVGATRYIETDGSVQYGASGIMGFVEFEGVTRSLGIYAVAVLISTSIAFVVITLLKSFRK